METKSNMRKFIDCDQSRMFLAEINRENKKKKNTIISTKNYFLSASLEISLMEEVEGNARQNQAVISIVSQVFLLFLLVSSSLSTIKNLG